MSVWPKLLVLCITTVCVMARLAHGGDACGSVRNVWSAAVKSDNALLHQLVGDSIMASATWGTALDVPGPVLACASAQPFASWSLELKAYLAVWTATQHNAAGTATAPPTLRGLGQSWSYIGPFIHGKTEYDGDVLASPDSALLRHVCTGDSKLLVVKLTTLNCFAHVRLVAQLITDVVGKLVPELQKPLSKLLQHRRLFAIASETAPEGIVHGFTSPPNTAWRDAGGARSLGPTQVGVRHDELNGLVQSLSDMTVLEFVGWAYTTVIVENVPEAGVTLQVAAPGVHTLLYSIGDGPVIPIAADQYNRRYEFTIADAPPLHQHQAGAGRKSGVRDVPLRLMARLRGVGQAGFTVTLQAKVANAGPKLKLIAPLAMPDFVWGGFFGSSALLSPTLDPKGAWISVPVSLVGSDSASASATKLTFEVRDASGAGTQYCVNAQCLVQGEGHTKVPYAANDDEDDVQKRLHRAAVQASINEEVQSWKEGQEGRGQVFAGDMGLLPGQLLAVRLFVAARPQQTAGRGGKCPVGAVNITAAAVLNSGERVSGWVLATFRCRDGDRETFVFTHLDRDGSVIGAAARAPIASASTETGDDASSSVPVVLSLHGTGVSAQSQADSYKVGDKKGGFTFGVRGAWVVAPDRHGAHNWEGIGRLSALAALFHVGYASAALRKASAATAPPEADTSRVVYAGHSMGGHGALHLAVMDPDRAICVMLLAPWITKEHYSTANTIFALDRSRVDGVTRGALESSIAGNDPDLALANIRHVPVLIRVGANDRTVHPFYARRIRRLLMDAGNTQVTYEETRQKEHWWWDTDSPNDGGCMNDKPIRAFLKRVLGAKKVPGTERRELHTVSTEQFPCLLRTFCITEQIARDRLSTVAIDERQRITTTNVRRLLLLSPEKKFQLSALTIDGWKLAVSDQVCLGGREPAACADLAAKHRTTEVCLNGSTWFECTQANPVALHYAGPFRSYSERPIAIAVDAGADTTVLKYAVYLSNLHFVAYDSFVPIVSRNDTVPSRRVGRSRFVLQTSLGGYASAHFVRLTLSSARLSWLDDQVTAVVEFESLRALSHGVLDIGMPSVPPMMRCPFGNMLLDNSTSDSRLSARGWASIGY